MIKGHEGMLVYLPYQKGYENTDGLFIVREMKLHISKIEIDGKLIYEEFKCDVCAMEHYCRNAEKFHRPHPCLDYSLPMNKDEFLERKNEWVWE